MMAWKSFKMIWSLVSNMEFKVRMLEIMEEKLLLKELWALESLSLIVAAWPLILLCRSESTLEASS